MKGPSRKEEPKSVSKDTSKTKSKSTSFDEAKASCKARKRKERQESISSIYQERKVIRSNSEERPTQKKHFENKQSIRRVFSNEDFQKTDPKSLLTNSPNRQPITTDFILIYDEDCEHERRRSHERFSKPLALKNKKSRRRPTAKYLPPKPKFKPEIPSHEETSDNQDGQNENKEAFLQLHIQEKERSPSPVRQFSPDLDLTTLHEQVDCSEPLLSCANHQINENTETLPGLSVASNRLLSSPRNSIIATHRIYLDPDIQQQSTFGIEMTTQNPLEQRLEKVSKQVNSLKKKIKKYESEFETKHGYKLSHADKLNDKNIRKLYTDLSKMKKEQKQLTDVCPSMDQLESTLMTSRKLQDTLNEIEKKLCQKRDVSNRPSLLEQMSSAELIDEKIAVQKALLYLESHHGRPDNKEDRNLARPIYDRYRNLKRLIGKIQSNPGNELATIHEDETMNFISSSTPQVSEVDSEKSSVMTSTDGSDTDTSISENLHSLTKKELIEQHKVVSEEKKELRRTIKMFELDIQKKSGRMVQKDDKLPMEHVYLAYKKVKAKLKLLDALVGKQL